MSTSQDHGNVVLPTVGAARVSPLSSRDVAPLSPAEISALDQAIALAGRGPVFGPNPRVGAVILDGAGRQLGSGWHRGAGTPHAEVAALSAVADAGHSAAGATAIVTLEPCSHQGRTAPCTEALLQAGIAKVIYAVADPNPAAAGGGSVLAAAGVAVVGPGEVPAKQREAAGELVRVWATAVGRGRPYVTLKTASTLDGRVAAADGTSKWITGAAARDHAHGVRATVGAILIGTGTALADDPQLSARPTTTAPHQPLRVVLGQREIPADARLRAPGAELLHLRTRDLPAALAQLADREIRHVLIEGGPTIATAALRAGVVDELHAYIAPVFLGAGAANVGPLGIDSITGALRFATVRVEQLGDDVLLVARPTGQEPAIDHGLALDAPSQVAPESSAERQR